MEYNTFRDWGNFFFNSCIKLNRYIQYIRGYRPERPLLLCFFFVILVLKVVIPPFFIFVSNEAIYIFSLFLGISILWYIIHRRSDDKTLQEKFVVSEIRR